MYHVVVTVQDKNAQDRLYILETSSCTSIPFQIDLNLQGRQSSIKVRLKNCCNNYWYETKGKIIEIFRETIKKEVSNNVKVVLRLDLEHKYKQQISTICKYLLMSLK